MDPTELIQTVLTYALPVLFAITVHEAAHGYAARHFGDNTAAMMGRITLNPLKHIDPVGTILMPLLLYFATSGAFVFNLFPLPPLDGGRILVGLLPYKQAMLVSRVEPWGFFIVMALVVSGVVSALWMQPLMGLTLGFIKLVLTPLRMLLL